jgi:hypothetical protein
MAEKSRVPWLSIVLTGLLAFVVSMAVIAAVMAGYAFALAMQAQGAPDPQRIAAFANHVIPILGPLALSLLVLFAARRVVRRAKSPQLWHGALVGVIAYHLREWVDPTLKSHIDQWTHPLTQVVLTSLHTFPTQSNTATRDAS